MPHIEHTDDHRNQEKPVQAVKHENVDGVEGKNASLARVLVNKDVVSIGRLMQEVADANLGFMDRHNSRRVRKENGKQANYQARNEACFHGPPDQTLLSQVLHLGGVLNLRDMFDLLHVDCLLVNKQ